MPQIVVKTFFIEIDSFGYFLTEMFSIPLFGYTIQYICMLTTVNKCFFQQPVAVSIQVLQYADCHLLVSIVHTAGQGTIAGCLLHYHHIVAVRKLLFSLVLVVSLLKCGGEHSA